MEGTFTLLALYNEFLVYQKKLVGTRKTIATYKTYTIRTNVMTKYLMEIGKANIEPHQINIFWVRDFAAWLYAQKNYVNDYVNKHIQHLARILNLAIEHDLIKFNCCDLYEFEYDRKMNLVYLEPFEIEKLQSQYLQHPTLVRIRDLFVFCCFTGLGHSDMQNFDANKHIVTGFDQNAWINIKRRKTNQESILPLLDPAKNILEKYAYQLPKISNQKFNQYLKQLFRVCKIDKEITTHSARKTFGMLMHNEYGVAKETVSRMLGHTSVKTTEAWYCKTDMRKIGKDMALVVAGTKKPVLVRVY